MLPDFAHSYLIEALEGTPATLNKLLGELALNDPRWDARPDPERFTLREIVSHLASVEPHWTERIVRMRDETEPFLTRLNAQDAKVENRSVPENRAAFAESRRQLISVLNDLKEAQWARAGRPEFYESVTIEQQAFLVLVHDSYHTRQIVEWLARA